MLGRCAPFVSGVQVERASLSLDPGAHLAVGVVIWESTGMPWPLRRHHLGLIADIYLEKLDLDEHRTPLEFAHTCLFMLPSRLCLSNPSVKPKVAGGIVHVFR